MAVADHTIKKDGILYRVGDTIPDSSQVEEKVTQAEPPKRGRKPKSEE